MQNRLTKTHSLSLHVREKWEKNLAYTWRLWFSVREVLRHFSVSFSLACSWVSSLEAVVILICACNLFILSSFSLRFFPASFTEFSNLWSFTSRAYWDKQLRSHMVTLITQQTLLPPHTRIEGEKERKKTPEQQTRKSPCTLYNTLHWFCHLMAVWNTEVYKRWFERE